MAHIIVNAVNLKSGGGLQIVGGLVARLSEKHRYTVLWTDQIAYDRISSIAGPRTNVSYVKPVDAASNMGAFVWLMLKAPAYLKSIGADAVLSVNHHFPTGRIPQIVYHMNVLRFERAKRPIQVPDELASRLRDWRAGVALRRAAANVFESEYLRDLAARRGAIRNPRVVYIGLDDRLTNPAVPQEAGDGGDILAVTSAQEHKDNPVLIRMLAALVARDPDTPWRLRIAGGRTPDAFADLQRLAEELGVVDRIDWLGFLDHATLADIGARSLCLVTPSRVESFCMVALEAMSWGCPAVVANSTAMPESVGDAGLIVEPGDADGFAEAVIRLQQEPGLRRMMVERGLELAGRRTWSAAASEFEAIFEAAMRQPASTSACGVLR